MVADVTPVEDVPFSLLRRAIAGDAEAVMGLVAGYVVPAAISLLAIFVGYLVAKYISRIASGPICRRIDQTLGKFIGKVIFYGVMLGVTAMVLAQTGFEMSGVATILAAAGFAIGLAFQGTLSNFAAGVLLLVFRPFKVGDFIHAAGVMGKVDEIDLFTTTLDTPDHRRIIVPNSSISGSTIENVSFHRQRRIDVPVGVAYQASVDATRRALAAACLRLEDRMIAGEGRGYTVMLVDLGPSSVNWVVRFWAASDDFFAVKELLTAEVKRQLDAAGISIPFPQMDIHLHSARRAEQAQPPAAVRQRPRLRDAGREALPQLHRESA